MMDLAVKKEIIQLKNDGMSNTEVARNLNINRKTVKKYWEEYVATVEQAELSKNKGDKVTSKKLLNLINQKPTYNSTNRGPRKYTPEIDAELDRIIAEHYSNPDNKKLNSLNVYKNLAEQGYQIGRVTIAMKIKEKLANFESKNKNSKIANLNF